MCVEFQEFLYFHFLILNYFILLHSFTLTLNKNKLYILHYYHKMLESSDKYRIPLLNRNNYEVWFQDMVFKLRGKELFYVIETSLKDFAWVRKLDANPVSGNTSSKSPPNSEIENLTSKFDELGGVYNLEKKRNYERDQARAFHIISISLCEDDKATRGQYENDVRGFWRSLKEKYQRTSQSTASQYMTEIQNFVFCCLGFVERIQTQSNIS